MAERWAEVGFCPFPLHLTSLFLSVLAFLFWFQGRQNKEKKKAGRERERLTESSRGGIWVLSPGNEELVTVLVDEMEALRVQREAGGKRTGAVGDAGGWEVLGEGRRGSEGFLYMLHPPGRGGVDYEIGEKGGRGGRVVVGAGDGRGKGRFGGFGRVLRGL